MKRSARGFTLLEVLVALAVIALGLAASIRIGATNSANAAWLREKSFAEWVALNKATELQLAETWPAAGDAKGTVTMANHDWVWQTRISETFEPRVRRLEVTVGSDAAHPAATVIAFLPQK